MRPLQLDSVTKTSAEGEGFEPPVLAHSCFQDSYHKPLGHPSEAWAPPCQTMVADCHAGVNVERDTAMLLLP